MLKIKEILNLIGFNGECCYKTIQELHDDPDMLFLPNQRVMLECIKHIALEIETDTGTEYIYPDGYENKADSRKYVPLQNAAHRKLFHEVKPEEEEGKLYE